MEFLMALKGFGLVFLSFRSLNTKMLFDFDLAILHQEFNSRLNQAVAPFRIAPKDIPIDFSIFVLSLVAGLISFSIVRV